MTDYSGNTMLGDEFFKPDKNNKPPSFTRSRLSRLATKIARHEIVDFYSKNLKHSLPQLINDRIENIVESKFEDLKKSKVAVAGKGTDKIDTAVEFAKLDYGIVHNEIIDIKTCRTNIFTGTVGILGALGVGVLGISGLKSGAPSYMWLPVATIISMGLLSVSILATIHKARGINMRTGYMRALSEWLKKNTSPPLFPGWQAAKEVIEHCQIYLNMKDKINEICPVKKFVTVIDEEKKEPSCVTKARKDSSKLNKTITIFPPLLHTFTSLTTYVYGTIYLIMILTLIFNSMLATKGFIGNFNYYFYWGVAIVGFIVTSIFGCITMRNKIKKDLAGLYENERMKMTKWEKAFKIYTIASSLLFPILLFGLVLLLFKELEIKDLITLTSIYSSGFIISVVAMYVAYVCYDKIYSLRKGRYSIERWYYLWIICFQHCPLMNIELVGENGKRIK